MERKFMSDKENKAWKPSGDVHETKQPKNLLVLNQSGGGIKLSKEDLKTRGFLDIAIERLMSVRKRVENGEYTEETIESKRLLFARWLYKNGRIGNDEDCLEENPEIQKKLSKF